MLHSNFPEYLDIHPSLPPIELASSLTSVFNQEDAIQQYGIAGRVWEAAYAMWTYLDPPPEMLLDPPFMAHSNSCSLTLIELGSGSGILTPIIASRLHSPHHLIIPTDLPEAILVCPLLHANLFKTIHDSTHPIIIIKPLAWGNKQHALDIASECLCPGNRTITHIICSDLVYFPDLLAPLLRSLIHLTSPPFTLFSGPTYESPHVVISYKIRSLSKESPFWSAFGLWFTFAPVLSRNKSTNGPWYRFGASQSDASIFIFIAHRRPESLHWLVPLDDSDLLNGVGAQGNPTRKNDDTFESLLLMSMDSDLNE
ncbi:hypothetical protein AMATHDRAFT_138336 [Amanita thiersii Skay4041]|uniref:Uncharacterized protein n=1 Tax=Amanita thiersii Skay4041 TaxID=703135 RepID=A0A2A9NZ09_9AGAR|nr:hypothetical protein AMATHDRAFT_138336 [Amanita thiersii Skay4041]